jgi:hypothetical protein
MKHVTLYLDDALWQAFRLACLTHHISASQAVAALMHVQLHDWTTPYAGQEHRVCSRLSPQHPKESPHDVS